MSSRQAAVAGTFYPDDPEKLVALLHEICRQEARKINKQLKPGKIYGGIVPHAGYVYSANEAVHFFHFLKNYQYPIDTIFILTPCHYFAEYDISLDSNDTWNTPLGDVALDLELMEFLDIPRSAVSHEQEHAGEVIVPYLQFFLEKSFKIVPVAMRKQSYKAALVLAEKIFKANQVAKKNIILIASSDFSHQVRPEEGFYNDNLVINRILNNSIHGLYDTIHENNISVCGYGPIMSLMFYARMIDPYYKVEILARGNSAKKAATELVVDYVSALFYGADVRPVI